MLINRIKALLKRPKSGADREKAHEGAAETEQEQSQRAAPLGQPAHVKRQKKTAIKKTQKTGEHRRSRKK